MALSSTTQSSPTNLSVKNIVIYINVTVGISRLRGPLSHHTTTSHYLKNELYTDNIVQDIMRTKTLKKTCHKVNHIFSDAQLCFIVMPIAEVGVQMRLMGEHPIAMTPSEAKLSVTRERSASLKERLTEAVVFTAHGLSSA